MRRIAMIAALLLLTGCANLKFAWSASYQTDNLAEDIKAARAEQAK